LEVFFNNKQRDQEIQICSEFLTLNSEKEGRDKERADKYKWVST